MSLDTINTAHTVAMDRRSPHTPDRRRRPTSAQPSLPLTRPQAQSFVSPAQVPTRRISSLQELPSYSRAITPPGSGIDDFSVLKKLGEGSSGSVYKVRGKVDGKIYVIKKVPVGHLENDDLRQPISEVLIMRRLHHPYIIHFHGSFVYLQAIYIIMEYADGGTLESVIQSRIPHQNHFTEDVLWRLTSEITSALFYLHSKSVVHRDLNTANVFLTKGMSIKIGDFGVACITQGHVTDDTPGAPTFMAPERFQSHPYDGKADIWSFGVILYYLASLALPFTGENILVLTLAICEKHPEKLPEHYSKEMQQFIMRLLSKNPHYRPDIDEVVSMLAPDVRAMSGSSMDSPISKSSDEREDYTARNPGKGEVNKANQSKPPLNPPQKAWTQNSNSTAEQKKPPTTNIGNRHIRARSPVTQKPKAQGLF